MGRPMNRRILPPLVFGVAGVAILLSLGNWQLRRLEWKTTLLDSIDLRMQSDPAELPESPDADAHAFLRVSVEGRIDGRELHVLTGDTLEGPGFRIVTRLDTDRGALLADLGYVPEAKKGMSRALGRVRIDGNLQWPREVDRFFTPDPDLARNIWFARDVPAMSRELGTRPVLVVASGIWTGGPGDWTAFSGTRPRPVAVGIPNDHLEYAITWFLLALTWSGMTAFFLWRIRRESVDRPTGEGSESA